MYRIGQVAEKLGLSVDTLRYYEKSGLLPPVARTGSGLRTYDEKDLSRLKFIQRAQKMDFSLAEIAALLEMREDPQHARDEVRAMVTSKLEEVESRLEDLMLLERELRLLINLCRGAEEGCPIIEEIDQETK